MNFNIKFIKTNVGHILMNPLGENLLILNKKTEDRLQKMYLDLQLYGEAYFKYNV